jgi:hypothetical protein
MSAPNYGRPSKLDDYKQYIAERVRAAAVRHAVASHLEQCSSTGVAGAKSNLECLDSKENRGDAKGTGSGVIIAPGRSAPSNKPLGGAARVRPRVS